LSLLELHERFRSTLLSGIDLAALRATHSGLSGLVVLEMPRVRLSSFLTAGCFLRQFEVPRIERRGLACSGVTAQCPVSMWCLQVWWERKDRNSWSGQTRHREKARRGRLGEWRSIVGHQGSMGERDFPVKLQSCQRVQRISQMSD
jgi:hypothetical protein